MNEVIIRSIKGIDKEIQKKRDRLNERRCWYLDEFRDKRYTWKNFYLGGYRILQEIKKLNIIKLQLKLMNDNERSQSVSSKN